MAFSARKQQGLCFYIKADLSLVMSKAENWWKEVRAISTVAQAGENLFSLQVIPHLYCGSGALWYSIWPLAHLSQGTSSSSCSQLTPWRLLGDGFCSLKLLAQEQWHNITAFLETGSLEVMWNSRHFPTPWPCLLVVLHFPCAVMQFMITLKQG